MKKVEGATTTLTPFSSYRIVNGVATKYYFANGERIAERTGTAATDVFYYHSDHLGSSNLVSNSAGTEVKSTLFYPYGSTRSETGAKTLAHQYTGQEKDATTGLYNYGARYYDPSLMHFISADNIIPDAADPQMLNRYSYVRNNPVRLVDPTGNFAVPAATLFIATVAALWPGNQEYAATGGMLLSAPMLAPVMSAYYPAGSWYLFGGVAGGTSAYDIGTQYNQGLRGPDLYWAAANTIAWNSAATYGVMRWGAFTRT